ncbi:unnamed protein product [Mycena citricolor]|uniref:Uncharacterized protein n=1 Tax=Mycena citricolor TaxID=2018698 RepID=A0AAD2GR68_9AGAR|nr:unnamed protein product [Mycena citricolor]CAK5262424.1 unnamed protein product [Mycena citricolor]
MTWLSLLLPALLFISPYVRALPSVPEARQTDSKLVFCHFMIGITSDRTSSSAYDDDMRRAKALGIDAFALNIGTDPYTDQQVFISFDFNWWSTSQGSAVGAKIAQYASLPAQLYVNGRVDNNGNNKAPSGGVTVTVNQGDHNYASTLGGKGYIAPASAWFSTHFGPEVSYSKNFVFPSDLLWYQRWVQILALRPQFVEIHSYGESHYIGPLSSPHTDDGGSKPHGGWLDMAKPFIAAFKAGLNCDATDTTMQSANNASGNYFQGRPNGFNSMADDVFVVLLLTAPGRAIVNSGGKAYTFDAPAGASAFSVPFHVGSQAFSLERGGAQILSATSLKLIQNTCPCGLYNFNAYVGTVPEGPRDTLQPDGLAAFSSGLKTGCSPVPSLPASPPAVTPATTTMAATAAPTLSH